MLKRITLKNLALLKDTDINFHSGFTVITGETGAGKSLLAEAFSILAGKKPRKDITRQGKKTAVIEGEFYLLNDHPGMIIRREISANGRTRSLIDDSITSNSKLIELTHSMIDITAQRSFSHLLDNRQHINFLDDFAGLQDKREEMKEFGSRYFSLTRKIGQLTRRRQNFLQRKEVISFQLGEINSIDPQPGENEEISNQLNRLENIEDLKIRSERVEDLLTGENDSVDSQLTEAENLLRQISDIDTTLVELIEELESAKSILKEISQRVAEQHGKLDLSENDIDTLRTRQYDLSGLVRKYGGSLESLFDKKRALEQEFNQADETDVELEELTAERSRIVAAWSEVAVEVSGIRSKKAAELQGNIETSLNKLGVSKAIFIINASRVLKEDGIYLEDGKRYNLTEKGLEDVEFLFSTNPGIDPKPLSQVASGGELSRLLLALKEAIPSTSTDATIIFDEIDTGVSGRIARLVGLKLKELSVDRQLLVITHLPQSASLADQHLKVSKTVKNGESTTEIKQLNTEQITVEIASLISSGSVTKAALEQANNLIQADG